MLVSDLHGGLDRGLTLLTLNGLVGVLVPALSILLHALLVLLSWLLGVDLVLLGSFFGHSQTTSESVAREATRDEVLTLTEVNASLFFFIAICSALGALVN